MEIIVSPSQMAMLEHIAHDGEHPSDTREDVGRWRSRCRVCNGGEPFMDGIEPYAVMAFPNSPLAQRKAQEIHHGT